MLSSLLSLLSSFFFCWMPPAFGRRKRLRKCRPMNWFESRWGMRLPLRTIRKFIIFFAPADKLLKDRKIHIYAETSDAIAGMLVAANDQPLNPVQQKAETGYPGFP